MVCVAALTVTVCASVVGTPISIGGNDRSCMFQVLEYQPAHLGRTQAKAENIPAVTKSKAGAGETRCGEMNLRDSGARLLPIAAG